MSEIIHVEKDGNNNNDGSKTSPMQTINAAAAIAQPGDTVIVHTGTYREWVSPQRGGRSDSERITFQAADNEEVIIKGSEIVDSWEPQGDNVWKAVLPNAMFADYNPYHEKIQGDWFVDKGRVHHTGDVYLNGISMFEVPTLGEVQKPILFEDAHYPDHSLFTWYTECDEGTTTIWANFQKKDPNEELVEINVRPACFFPKETGINFITIRGFNMCQAATQWAPPTAEQTGLIGPNWSKGWIIEDNIIHDSRCSGISLGKEKSTGQNRWSKEQRKHGTQHEREVVFNAIHFAGWHKDNIGSHIVRNNTIYNCEQTGICGHMGGAFSEISGNHIYDIYIKRQFYGFEIGGIKLHAPIDTLISENYIHNTTRGTWLDWQAQGTRVSSNVFHDNSSEDLFIEVSHGPYMVDNNIMLSPFSVRDVSQGGAFVHNLIGGEISVRPQAGRFTHYHYPHSTAVNGMMTILNGDNRFYNNIFIPSREKIEDNTDLADAGDMQFNSQDDIPPGLSVYNKCPDNWDPWDKELDREQFSEMPLPVAIASNVYFNGSQPYEHEKEAVVNANLDPSIELQFLEGSVELHITMDESMDGGDFPQVTTAMLGKAHQPEAGFDDPDGSDIAIVTDICGNPRTRIIAGPFSSLINGRQQIKAWQCKTNRK